MSCLSVYLSWNPESPFTSPLCDWILWSLQFMHWVHSAPSPLPPPAHSYYHAMELETGVVIRAVNLHLLILNWRRGGKKTAEHPLISLLTRGCVSHQQRECRIDGSASLIKPFLSSLRLQRSKGHLSHHCSEPESSSRVPFPFILRALESFPGAHLA
jgi:hypothetical protein